MNATVQASPETSCSKASGSFDPALDGVNNSFPFLELFAALPSLASLASLATICATAPFCFPSGLLSSFWLSLLSWTPWHGYNWHTNSGGSAISRAWSETVGASPAFSSARATGRCNRVHVYSQCTIAGDICRFHPWWSSMAFCLACNISTSACINPVKYVCFGGIRGFSLLIMPATRYEILHSGPLHLILADQLCQRLASLASICFTACSSAWRAGKWIMHKHLKSSVEASDSLARPVPFEWRCNRLI